ncbi:MAG: helix-turn-helix domain-containing protein [Clostridiales Family XIII bacterium]|jgi:transcriptional regulator with XRE-family HTH domain|nr:helix-turn-helix domain-containing protein [Clostridiales Family XIII bacterium]
MKHFMEIFRGLREDHDMTQQQIADVLGTSQTMYARYERGANELPLRHFVTLCQYYKVSADVMLGLKKQEK